MQAFALLCALGMGLAAPAAAEEETRPPDELVREQTERVRELIRENVETYREDKSAFYEMVDEEIVPVFDLPFISQLVLARHWRDASDEQRERFQEAFKKMLVRNYGDALLEYYDAVEADWKPLRMEEGADKATVRTELKPEDGEPLPIGFVMHKKDEGWKVYDLTIENVSLVTNFRAQFAQEVRKNGIDGLIEKMEEREIETPEELEAKG